MWYIIKNIYYCCCLCKINYIEELEIEQHDKNIIINDEIIYNEIYRKSEKLDNFQNDNINITKLV